MRDEECFPNTDGRGEILIDRCIVDKLQVKDLYVTNTAVINYTIVVMTRLNKNCRYVIFFMYRQLQFDYLFHIYLKE